ncbi:WD and tetratricopeptide repeats protein 1 isoform X2 [Solanum pennellii]|uniref:WD and tetratricopeptide repeats protein 1 isoform X2 n=1 Tax=Solanum pennellii TaxID=28526 RepID=A0ABM1GI40_SOLPN|nr:WD and tetratricopeptide repeats protein 1 isoform X2 [Solanum pennellii]
MESLCFHDGNITNLINKRYLDVRHDSVHELQMHSSLVKRMALERELEGHQGCVNAIAWNSKGSLLISGSDDTRMNIWSYSGHKLLHSIETGHSANIFCTKFIPETSDELVVSGAGDAEVRLFHLSHQKGRGEDNTVTPAALFQCHTRRVKKLAVEVGNPHVVWSASEDGTVRQHDLREGASCPPAGSSRQECRNILLDLRCGAKKSLADPPKQLFALKSCDISSTRPHLLIVGGSDAFARLYDRRMLPPLSSSQKKLPPPPCVSYFCPMHLSDRGRSNLHMTHVAFSPNGEEVLLSYSGEHVYLMDVNPAYRNSISYTSGDVSNLMNFAPSVNGIELQSSVSGIFLNGSSSKRIPASKLEKCKRLIQMALNSLKEDSNFYYGIEACNEVLDGCRAEIGPLLSFECLCTRAAILLKLGKHKEALEFAIGAQSLATSNSEVALKVESIKEQIAAAEADKTNRANGGESRSDPRAGRILSLSDILYRSDANSDASQDGHRSERDDSDDDEELELAFETSMSGDEGQDVDPNVLHGSLNLRIHRRGDSTGETGQANGSCGSPASCQKEKTAHQPETVIDMKQRYVGHCNVGTDIKQASFLGERGEYIASGSDDGRWFIWEKRTGRLIKMLHGDEAVVNCVQCHPYDGVVATSGIDNTIKIWTPTASVPSLVAGGAAGPETSNVLDAMESNQRRLCRTREAVLPFEFLERFRMHEFTEGSLHPFECTQS